MEKILSSLSFTKYVSPSGSPPELSYLPLGKTCLPSNARQSLLGSRNWEINQHLGIQNYGGRTIGNDPKPERSEIMDDPRRNINTMGYLIMG